MDKLNAIYKPVEKSITFSSDTGMFSFEDLEETGRIAEEFFQTHEDPDQMEVSDAASEWITKRGKDYFNVIKDGAEVTGFTFSMPCTRENAEDFVTKRINERELFEKIRVMNVKFPPEAIYLCSFFMKEKYRRKGLITMAILKTLNRVTQKLRYTAEVFSWAYTSEGLAAIKKIEKITGIPVRLIAE